MEEYRKHRGAVMTGIVLIVCVFLITFATVLITPIEKNYTLMDLQLENTRDYYFAEGGWAYFKNQWKKGKIKGNSPWEVERKVAVKNGANGWFEIKLTIDSAKDKVYNIKLTGGREGKKEGSIIQGKIQLDKKDIKVLEWHRKK